MNDTSRAAFLARAKGPICVSYRLPVRLAAALAMALTAPASAQDAQPAAQTGEAGAPCEPAPRRMAGTVRDPSDASWVEDTSLPELPVAADDTAAIE